MTAVLPHYKPGGPANLQVATLVYGGQFVMANNATPGTTDLSVKVATSAATTVLGVAGTDANVVTTQTGGANSYGQPLIDISVLTDYASVYYGGWDIWCWFVGAASFGQKLIIGATGGAVTGAGAGPAADQVVGVCSMPGGVSSAMLTQQIGGSGSAVYFLGRARVL
jgi:hypothetical protein